MHKKLEADLISLAHRILKIKGKSDVFTLQRLSKDLYEKLSLLAFVEEYVNHTPGIKETKEELLEKVEKGLLKKQQEESVSAEDEISTPEKIVHELIEQSSEKSPKNETDNQTENSEDKSIENPTTEITEQPFDELKGLLFGEPELKDEVKEESIDIDEKETSSEAPKTALDEELQDTISVDVMADLFENAQPKSLNEKLATTIQIGLNDRIAFVKHLFKGEQEDYNRVISQLNTFKTEKEARKFINKMVKPDYDWSEQEELEARFLEIITRKFA